ncbi:MAG: preprotein translocase subunit SecE [Desulfovibrionaceae bacterium]|nr:preprotein translocase subunit SecE [Desulfovibrionaceae bacterium]
MAKEKKVSKAGQSQKAAPSTAVSKVREFKEFLEESKVEIKKVVWPSRKETVTTSVAVIVFTLAMAIFLGLVDLGLSKLVKFILS